MFKKRNAYLVLTLFVTFGLILAACGTEEGTADPEGNGDGSAVEPQEWDIAIEEGDGSVQHEYAKAFADLLHEKSDGQITLNIYLYGQLGDTVDQVEMLQNGDLEFGIVTPAFTTTTVPESNIFSLHFLFPSDPRLTQEILNTSEALNVDLREIYEENDILPLAYWTEGFQQWTSNRPLRSLEDFDGFAMRVMASPILLRSYEEYGADPTALDWGELYTGLAQGLVDGQENPIFFIADEGFYEVQDYMTISEHYLYVTSTSVNPDFYYGLDDETRAIIDEAIEEMREVGFDIQERLNNENLAEIEASGTEIIELSDAEREEFRQAALAVHEFYKDEYGETARAIYEKLKSEIEAAQ